MRTIRVSAAVWAAIAERGKFGETEDDVLRRVLGISSATEPERRESKSGRRGRGSLRYATKRVSRWVSSGRFHVEIEGGQRKDWPLPNPSDKNKVRRLRDEAMAFGREHGLTAGQIDAIKKGLTEAGYYVTGPRARSVPSLLKPEELGI